MRVNFKTANSSHHTESVSLMVSQVIIESEQELNLIMEAAKKYVDSNPEIHYTLYDVLDQTPDPLDEVMKEKLQEIREN